MDDIRKKLAYLIVGSWALSVLFFMLIIVFDFVDINKGIEMLKNFSSISSGFVGMILGYYFTKRGD